MTKTPRLAQPRTWATLALASVSLAMPAQSHPQHPAPVAHTTPNLWLAESEGGEGGESGAAAESPADAGYLTALSLIEGHLRVGFALYSDGHPDLAITHMKHPKDEIYTELAPELADHGAAGFADELATLSDSVTAGKPLPEVTAAYHAVLDKTEAARNTGKSSPRTTFDAIIAVTRVAAEEHAIGIVDGKVANLHEYQDAWGFIETAKALAESMTGSTDPKVAAAAQKTLASLNGTADAFDGLVPDAVAGGGDILLAAAGAIELAAYGVK